MLRASRGLLKVCSELEEQGVISMMSSSQAMRWEPREEERSRVAAHVASLFLLGPWRKGNPTRSKRTEAEMPGEHPLL